MLYLKGSLLWHINEGIIGREHDSYIADWVPSMSFIRSRLFWAVALGHTTVDTFNSVSPVMIAFLSGPLGLSYVQVGLATSLYTIGGSVSQPLFGWLADRYGSRLLAGLGVLWLGSFIVLATITAGFGQFVWLVVPYALAALGSAVYHPVGAANVSATTVKQTATATAFFFLFGQIGLAGGPVVGGFLMQKMGMQGIQLLALAFSPVVILLFTAPFPQRARILQGSTESTTSRRVMWSGLLALALLAAARSWAQLGTVAFLPKLFQDKGWDPTSYGAITGTMWLASAIMGVLAGHAADRWGRRRVVFWVLVGAVIPLYFLPTANNWLAFLLAFLAGGFTGAPHSILVLIAQGLLPGKKAMASGIALGYMFAMGAVANIGIGWLADRLTLATAMQVGAGMSLLAGIFALALPSTRETISVLVEDYK